MASAASMATFTDFVPKIDRVAAAVARAEAGPHDALRQAHPREQPSLEDLRLERHELKVGCWASRRDSPHKSQICKLRASA